MCEYIKGEVVDIDKNYITLESKNIGYVINVGCNYFNIGENIKLYIYILIREPEIKLYGFLTKKHKELFLKLLKVKGIGPKSALIIVSKHNIDNVYNEISRGNYRYLLNFPGIGEKSAKQIILELKGKLTQAELIDPKLSNVEKALIKLGFKTNDIRNSLKNIDLNLSTEEIIKVALKNLVKE